MDKIKVILDTDIGTDIDDSECLAYLLCQDRCDLLGVTTVSAKKVRVMSYNVHNCIGSDGIKSYKRCAEIILDAKPDIVAIQEVDSMASRRNNCYVLGEMAKHCGYHPYYGKTIPFQGGAYGIGVLTKEKALSVEFHRLPCRKEPRGLLVVEMKDYYLLATHLF